jgi:hypothetical protein
MDFLDNYTKLTWFNFPNLNLDFSRNWFNEINFTYNNIRYTWRVIGGLNDTTLKLVEYGKLNVSAISNTLLKHNDFDFFLYDANQNPQVIISQDRLLKDVKLGILANE